MFAIYDQFAMKFRDSLDELNKVVPLLQSDMVDSDTTKSFEEALHNNQNDYEKNENQSQEDKSNSSHTQEAISAYKQIAKINYNEEVHHVNQIMTHKVITAYTNDTISVVYDLMIENEISQIPIINEHNQIGGVLSKDDLLKLMVDNFIYDSKIMATFTNNEIFRNEVNTILDNFIITTDPITDVRRVAKVMNKYKLNAIAVVDEYGKLVGIASKSDIVRVVSNEPHYQMWS
jgi:CBS domain-containing protein